MSQNESMVRRRVIIFTNAERRRRNITDWSSVIDGRAMQLADYAFYSPDLEPEPPFYIPIIKNRSGFEAKHMAKVRDHCPELGLILSQMPRASFRDKVYSYDSRGQNALVHLVLPTRHDLAMFRLFEYAPYRERPTLYD